MSNLGVSWPSFTFMKRNGPAIPGVDVEDEFEAIRSRCHDRAPLHPSYNELSGQVIGAAIKVHTKMGPGFIESFYQRAMAIELGYQGIPFRQQAPLSVSYRDKPIGDSFLDLLVDERLVVELKSVDAITSVHRMQIRSYLRAGDFHLGLIINFNVAYLREGIARVINTPLI